METEASSLLQLAGAGSTQYQSQGSMTVNNVNQYTSSNYKAYLKFVEEYEQELKNGSQANVDFINKIQHYLNNIDGEEFIGLQRKLEEADYSSDFLWANELKESYTKKLTELSLSQSSQKIHAYLLLKIYTFFNFCIKPAIIDGVPKEVIKKRIISDVIMPLTDIVDENNILEFYDDDFLGMLYFLTGNCHLRWK